MLPGRSVPMHPGDQRILEIARDLCQQLGISKFNLRFITWVGRIGYRQMPADYMRIARDSLWLPKTLMEKLDPEDWRPLLASGLLYYGTYQKRIMVKMFTTVMLPVLGFFLAFALYFEMVGFSSPAARLGNDVLLVLFAVVEIYALIRWLRGYKRSWLEAHDKAAGLVGKEVFLKTLEKIQSLGPIRGPPVRTYPSVPERIRNLSLTGN